MAKPTDLSQYERGLLKIFSTILIKQGPNCYLTTDWGVIYAP